MLYLHKSKPAQPIQILIWLDFLSLFRREKTKYISRQSIQ